MQDVKKSSNNRINRMLSVCRSLLKFLGEEDEYDYQDIIGDKIKNLPKISTREIVFLDNWMILELFEYFMNHRMYRDAVLLGLAYESAGRKTELVQVKKNSINVERNNTNIVEGKRGKKFNLIYFDLTQKAAKKYFEEREDELDSLFVTDRGNPATGENLYQWVVSWRKILYQLTGNELEFNIHSFRHSALQNYGDGTHEVCKKRKIKNVTIEDLKRIAHHESIEITMSYLKKDDDVFLLENLFKIKFKD